MRSQPQEAAVAGCGTVRRALFARQHASLWHLLISLLLFAMACGTVCVTTDAGDSRDLVGNTGRVVARGDMAGLAEAVVDMLSLSEKDNLDMSSSARRRIVDRFEIGKVARMFRNLYSEALTNQKRTG